MRKGNKRPGSNSTRSACWIGGKSKSSWACSAPSSLTTPKSPGRFAPKPTTLRPTRSACATLKFRRQHLFVGSGVIEAGCKTVVASRLKRSGMFWTVRGANAILALRCAYLNGRFEDYWDSRQAAMAA